jgi:hypothetical protein
VTQQLTRSVKVTRIVNFGTTIWLLLVAFISLQFATPVSGDDFEVTAPPKHLKGVRRGKNPTSDPPPLDTHYTKYIGAKGYPILASDRVSDYAMKEAAYLVNMMLAKRPDVRDAMIKSGSRMLVFAHDEFTTDLPEYAGFTPKDYWDRRARGFGGSQQDPVCSVAEENVLGFVGDPYKTECILIHEFAHNIHLRGLVNIDLTFDRRLKEAYESSMSRGLWKDKYASVNRNEYWAEGVQSWFNNNRKPDHDHNFVDTREELIEYDSRLAQLCEEVFGDTKLVYKKPATRLVGHMQGYDPGKAPTFRWPKRLEVIQVNLKLKWTSAKDTEIPNSQKNETSTWVMFRNQSGKRVKVGWYNFEGKLHLYEELPPGHDFSQKTFAGHTWVVTDKDENPLGFFVASPSIAKAMIPEIAFGETIEKDRQP